MESSPSSWRQHRQENLKDLSITGSEKSFHERSEGTSREGIASIWVSAIGCSCTFKVATGVEELPDGTKKGRPFDESFLAPGEGPVFNHSPIPWFWKEKSPVQVSMVIHSPSRYKGEREFQTLFLRLPV